MDTNKDGSLSRDEIVANLKNQQDFKQMSHKELQNFVKLADQNDDGDLTFPEFLASVVTDADLMKEENMKMAFNMLDHD